MSLIKLISGLGLFLLHELVNKKKIPRNPILLNVFVKGALHVFLFHYLEVSLTSDLKFFYIPQGELSLSGGVPNRDFESSYGPLFPIFFGTIWFVTGPDVWFILLILVDSTILAIALRISRNTNHRGSITKRAYWFWLCNPLLLWITIGNGQQQILIAFFGFIAILIAFQGRIFVATIILGIGTLITKLLLLSFVPVILAILQKSKWNKRGIILLIAPMIYVAVNALIGASPYESVISEANKEVPGSISYWIIEIGNLNGLSEVFLAANGIIVLISTLYLSRYITNLSNLALITVFSISLFFVLGPRIYPNYYLIILPFFLLIEGSNLQKTLIRLNFICTTLALFEASIYFNLQLNMKPDILESGQGIPLMLLDFVIISLHAISCVIIFQALRKVKIT